MGRLCLRKFVSMAAPARIGYNTIGACLQKNETES